MSAMIIVEDGSGTNPDANSYLSLADAETYFAASLYHTDWDSANDDTKTRLLLTATKVLDNSVQFNGYKRHEKQALQWPRYLARDPNKFTGYGWWSYRPEYFYREYWNPCEVPKGIKDIQCELSRFLLTAFNDGGDDRTADAPGTGIDSFEIYQGVKVKFNAATQRPIIPQSIQFALMQFGQPFDSDSASVKIRRA